MNYKTFIGLLAVVAVAGITWAGVTNRFDVAEIGTLNIKTNTTGVAIAQATHATNADNVLNASWITNSVVSGVVTNGDGSITVTTTNLVYLGLRP